MKTIIFNSLRQQPTATNEKSLSFNWNIFLPKSFIVDRANKFLSSGNSIVFLLVETMWKQFFRMWKRILSTNSLFRWRKRIFCLVETLLNKRLNEIFFKKIRFHYAEKLLSVAGYQKTKKKRRKWFPIARERLLYKKWHHFNMNNGFYYQKFCS